MDGLATHQCALQENAQEIKLPELAGLVVHDLAQGFLLGQQKIEQSSLKFLQPVLIQVFEDLGQPINGLLLENAELYQHFSYFGNHSVSCRVDILISLVLRQSVKMSPVDPISTGYHSHFVANLLDLIRINIRRHRKRNDSSGRRAHYTGNGHFLSLFFHFLDGLIGAHISHALRSSALEHQTIGTLSHELSLPRQGFLEWVFYVITICSKLEFLE